MHSGYTWFAEILSWAVTRFSSPTAPFGKWTSKTEQELGDLLACSPLFMLVSISPNAPTSPMQRATPLWDRACPTQSLCLPVCACHSTKSEPGTRGPGVPLAQGLGSARTQDGARTSCLSFRSTAEEERGGRPAGVLKGCAGLQLLREGRRMGAGPPLGSEPPPPCSPCTSRPVTHPTAAGQGGGFQGRGLTPLPQEEPPRCLRPPLSGKAKMFPQTGLQTQRAANACFEYQRSPKIKKEKRKKGILETSNVPTN